MTKKYSIHLKGGFSERKGLINFSDVVQTTSINDRTRNKIYSAIEDTFESLSDNSGYSLKDKFCEYLYEEVLSLTRNHIPQSYNDFYLYDYDDVFKEIYEIVLTYEYNELLDLIEAMINIFEYLDKKNPYKYESKRNSII